MYFKVNIILKPTY